ncbi:MAG: hypothetical protein FJX68_03705 [Alphaproteobacteria bacterium]|nr:hypothetical protein [Alphaproteobacteria bacterium]
MNILVLESVGALLVVLALVAWVMGRRNQKSNNRWSDQAIIVLAGFVTIALITGLAMILDGVL